MLDLTSLSSNKDIVLIDLIKFCWFITELELFDIVLSSSFQIYNCNIDQAFLVNRKAESSSWALNDANFLVPLDLNHAVSLARNSARFIFLNNDWLWLFLRNRISILINLLFLILSWSFFLGWRLFNFRWYNWGFFFWFLFTVWLLSTTSIIQLIYILDGKYYIWMRGCWPNTQISVNTFCSKVFIIKFLARQCDNGNDFSVMSFCINMILVSIFKSKYNKVSFPERWNN